MKTATSRTIYKEMLRSLVGLSLLGVLNSSPAWAQQAQPLPADPSVRANQMCMQATTPTQFREAFPFCLQLAQEIEQHPDMPHRDERRAGVLWQLVWCKHHMSQLQEAAEYTRRLVTVQKKIHGPEHVQVAAALSILGEMLNFQGQKTEAMALFLESLAVRRKLLGKEHLDIAESLADLARVLTDMGKYGEAEPLIREGLSMQRKFLGKENLEVATTLDDLADLLFHQGKYAEAESLFRETLAIRRKLTDKEDPRAAISLCKLGEALEQQGKYSESEFLQREAMAMRQRLEGKESIGYLYSLSALATVQLRGTVSETRVQALLQSLRAEEDMVYSLLLTASHSSRIKRLALRTSLLRKGRAAEAGTAANRVLHASKSRPEVSELYTRWQSLRQQREFLFYGGVGTMQPAAYQTRIRELSMSADTIEYQLANKMPALRSLHPSKPDVILAEVAKQLPQDGVLMEILWVRPLQAWVKAAPSKWGPAHYVALLLFPDERIEVQDLGEAAVVETESRALLSALASPSSDPVGPAGVLYERILAPLLAHLNGIHHLYLSPDGVLNLVPFEALHDGTEYVLGRSTESC